MSKKNRQLLRALSILAFFYGVLLPISTKLANVFLAITILTSVYGIWSFKSCVKKKKARVLLVSSIFLFVPCVVSLVNEANYYDVINIAAKRSVYLIVPIVFFFLPLKALNVLKEYSFRGLVWGASLSSVYLLVSNVIQFVFYSEPLLKQGGILNYYHTNIYFTNVLNFHPSYYGVYLLFAMIIILHKNNLRKKYIYIVHLLVLLVSLVFVNSRVITILLLVVISFTAFSFVLIKFKRKVVAIPIGTSIVLGILAFFLFSIKNTYVFQKVTKELRWELNDNKGTKYNSKSPNDSRMVRWKAAIDLIKERPIFGFGVNQEINNLKRVYKNNGLKYAYENEYNAHNQYLGYAIEGGLISMFALLNFLIGSLILAVIKKDKIYFLLTIITIALCVAENFLIRNAGIIFISFFFTIIQLGTKISKQNGLCAVK